MRSKRFVRRPSFVLGESCGRSTTTRPASLWRAGLHICVEVSMKTSKKKADPLRAMRIDIERVIRSIPRGKVATYGRIARMAGYPGAARMVARILRRGFGLPWQRVLGAGGQIKLTGDSAIEQRLRLESEGVVFRGRRVDMKACEFRPKSSRQHFQSRRRSSRS